MPPQSRGSVSAPIPTAFPEDALSAVPATDDFFSAATFRRASNAVPTAAVEDLNNSLGQASADLESPGGGISSPDVKGQMNEEDQRWPLMDEDRRDDAQTSQLSASRIAQDPKVQANGGVSDGSEFKAREDDSSHKEFDPEADLDSDASFSSSSESSDGDETPETKSTSTTSPPQPPLHRSASADNVDGVRKQAPKRPRMLPHTSSQLFPPFYNRPPTPLPPSPSLTSLLRPSFGSAQSSRPSTPDTSDAESLSVPRGRGSARDASSTASSNFRATGSNAPQPRTSIAPKIPTYEYYGFALYLFSTISFIMYILWAVLPAPLLHRMGIWYYPDRWWALAVPAWIVVFLVYIYVALASWNTQYLTLKVGDSGGFVDSVGAIAIVDEEGNIIRKKRYLGGASNKDPSPANGSSKSRGSAKGEKNRSHRGKNHRPRTGDGVEMLSPTPGARSTSSGHKKKHQRSRRNSLINQDKGPDPQQAANLLGKDVDWRKLWNDGTDAVMDVPIGGVCEVLYGLGHEAELSDD